LKHSKAAYFADKFTQLALQKEIYFNPGRTKNPEELHWLSTSDADTLWVFTCPEAAAAVAEDMLISKLIKNPKLLNDDPAHYNILSLQAGVRLSTLMKIRTFRKVVLFGVHPPMFGIHFPLPLYAIVPHNGMFFLCLDAPDSMLQLPPAAKTSIASALKELQLR